MFTVREMEVKTGRISSAHRLFLYFIYTMPRSVVLIIYNPGIYSSI